MEYSPPTVTFDFFEEILLNLRSPSMGRVGSVQRPVRRYLEGENVRWREGDKVKRVSKRTSEKGEHAKH